MFGATLAAATMPRVATADPPDRETKIAGLDVAVWLPAGGTGPHPLVLFSHGVRGCKTQSSYLMRALARGGFLVVAADHKGDKANFCPDRRPGFDDLPPGFLAHAAAGGPTFYEERGKNLRDLRAALLTDTGLSPLIDPGRVALVGHSLGGYTVLGLAGAWPGSWRMDKIAAVVALAPFVQPFGDGTRAAGISVPVLYQVGDKDLLVTPAFEQMGFYAATPKPSCKVVYEGADHFAWVNLKTDPETHLHEVTAAAVVAFLNTVFAGSQPPTAAILSPSPTAPPADCK